MYSYIIDGVRKADPFLQKVIEIIKGQPESVTYHSTYVYTQEKKHNPVKKVFEVYLPEIAGDTFQDKAKEIIAKAEGYSHIQIMPFNYTPNKKTLGYKTSTYFAPEPKYGDLDDLKEAVDILHENDFGVIFDFSIFEFEEFTKTGLQMFDGSPLFERDNREQHQIFTGYFFDYEKPFVRSFLKEIVRFLIEDLQADGVRVDGVNEIAFISDGITQEVNEKGVEFLKEILSELPEDIIFIADMLTHHTLEELGLERINFVEGNMFMFQVQKILFSGKEWFEKNKDREVELLFKTLSLVQKNKIISTINHDIHIDGVKGKLHNGKLPTKEQFDLLKMLLFALPVPKQVFHSATLDEKFVKFIEEQQFINFHFNIFQNNVIRFSMESGNKGVNIDYVLFENKVFITYFDTVQAL